MIISSSSTQTIPLVSQIKQVCKATSVLDAILSPEVEYRYYTYQTNYHNNQDYFETNNGHGDYLQILIGENQGAINGFYHELYDYESDFPKKQDLLIGVDQVYLSFYNSPLVSTIGSTFCIWLNPTQQWTTSPKVLKEDGSEDLLDIFDLNPQTYREFAREYYEVDIPLATIEKIYNLEPLTLDMVNALNPDLQDFSALKKDLNQIGYPQTL